MAMMKKILLVGRSGNGITVCANSINNIQNPVQTLAIECSGVGDTGDDRTLDEDSVRNNVRNAIETNGGFDAICLVLKYGSRFTKQEKDAVLEVKSMFGQDVFRHHGIIIMNYGDLFEVDHEDDELSFTDWLKAQTGDIEILFQEVSLRVYLFDNKTQDKAKKLRQVETLNKCFTSLSKTYKLENFQKAERERKTNTIESIIATLSHEKQRQQWCIFFTFICLAVLTFTGGIVLIVLSALRIIS